MWRVTYLQYCWTNSWIHQQDPQRILPDRELIHCTVPRRKPGHLWQDLGSHQMGCPECRDRAPACTSASAPDNGATCHKNITDIRPVSNTEAANPNLSLSPVSSSPSPQNTVFSNLLCMPVAHILVTPNNKCQQRSQWITAWNLGKLSALGIFFE